MTPSARLRAQLPTEQPGSRPVLTQVQLEVLRRYGIEQEVAAGDVLFADGDVTYDLVVVLEGAVDIVEHYGRPDEIGIAAYGPFEFLGEMGLLTGQHAYLTAVASAPAAPSVSVTSAADRSSAWPPPSAKIHGRALGLRPSTAKALDAQTSSSAPQQ